MSNKISIESNKDEKLVLSESSQRNIQFCSRLIKTAKTYLYRNKTDTFYQSEFIMRTLNIIVIFLVLFVAVTFGRDCSCTKGKNFVPEAQNNNFQFDNHLKINQRQ